MNNNELIEKVIAKISGDPELLKTVGELTLDKEDIELASSQRTDTMYILTGRVTVKSDSPEQQYHYHPIIEDCFFNPEATENKMVCSDSLISMQELQKKYESFGSDTVILAVSIEKFEKLQQMLDETIAELMGSVRRAAETIIRENENRIPSNSVDFYKMYRAILMHLMMSTNTVIGSALTDKSEIVESIDGVEYENPVEDYDCNYCDDCDSCDDCYNFDCEDCFNEDDPPEHYHGTFFGTIRRD